MLVMEGGIHKPHTAGDDPSTQRGAPDVRALGRSFQFLIASKEGCQPGSHKDHQDHEAYDTPFNQGREIETVAVAYVNSIIRWVEGYVPLVSRFFKVLQGDAIPVTITHTKYRVKTCSLDRHVPDKVTVRECVVSILNGDIFLDNSSVHERHEAQDDREERESYSLNLLWIRDE